MEPLRAAASAALAAFAAVAERLPALPPAVGVLLGAALAARASWLPVPLLVLLLAAGLALRGGAGGVVAGSAAGLVAAAMQLGLPGEPWRPLDRDRPVAVVGRVAGHARPTGWGWRTTLQLERLAQGRWVSTQERDLFLDLPEGEAPPSPGAWIAARGYTGRAPGYANRSPVGPGPWRLRVKSRRLLTVEEPPAPAARAAAAVRAAVEEAWARASGAAGVAAAENPDGAPARAEIRAGPALVRALVLGEPSGLPPAWLRGLRRTGLSHLLAVSGLHVGLVAAIALFAAAPLPRWARVGAALAAVALYLLVAGPRPALLRASLMALAAGAAYQAGRLPSAGNALALAAAGLVIARPELIADLGFGLTVAATAGLIFLAPPLARAWGGGEGRRGARAWTARALAATVAAQLASAPLALPAFHLLAPASPLLNLVAVPWTALALAVGLGWCAVALVSAPAAAAAVPLLDGLAAPFGWPALGPPQAWGTVAVAASPWACLAGAAVLAAVLLRPRRLAPWFAALVLVGMAAAWGRGERSPEGRAAVVMFDVGQGDSLLLTGGRRTVLVDGGGWRRGDFGGRVLLPALLAEGVSRLDVAVLTHPDTDHCGGLVDLASYLPIGEVWTAATAVGEGRSPCGEALAAAPGVRLRPLAAGDHRAVGSWRFEVLSPERDGPARGSDNDRSLVLAAAALGRRILLTGDVEAAAERRVAARLAALGAPRFDLLKVAHHGSKTSTTLPLLAAVHPRLALVSAGPANPYGHPAVPVLARLARAGARVLRTDLQGEIRLSWREDGPLRLELPGAPR